MNCDECNNEIVGEAKQSFLVNGYFCSEGCRNMTERAVV